MKQQNPTRISLSHRSPPSFTDKQNAPFEAQGQQNTEESIHEQPVSDPVEAFQESQLDSIFVGFAGDPVLECCGIEIGNISRRPTLVKEEIHSGNKEKYNAVRNTNHRNLVNLKGFLVTENTVQLSYEQMGIPLKQIQKLSTFDRNAVATICKEVIHGLIYIHEVLKISHGELNSGNVHINEDGEVQIGNIGRSMMQLRSKTGVAHDIQAVYDIAADLLDLQASSDRASMSFLLADHFTKMSPNIRLSDLLKHPFFNISQGPWYLSYLGMLPSFLQKHQCGRQAEESEEIEESDNEQGMQ